VLAGANDLCDYDPKEGPANPTKSWTMQFKAAPKKHIGMEFEKVWQQAWKEGKNDKGEGNGVFVKDNSKVTEKVTSSLKLNHGDCQTKWTFSNEKFFGEGSGILFNEDGYNVKLTGSAEHKPKENEWKATGKLAVKTPDMGGAKVAGEVTVEHKWADKESTTVKCSKNVTVSEDVSVGGYMEHDTAKFKKQIFHTVYTPKDGGKFWFRGNMMTKTYMAGCWNQINENIDHSWEVAYNTTDGAENSLWHGQPVALRGGVAYNLSGKTDLEAAASWDSNITVSQTVTHQCDKNWTVKATQDFDSSKIGTEQTGYNLHFGVTYKL